MIVGSNLWCFCLLEGSFVLLKIHYQISQKKMIDIMWIRILVAKYSFLYTTNTECMITGLAALEKQKYQLNSVTQMWPSGLTLAMTLIMNFHGQIWNLDYVDLHVHCPRKAVKINHSRQAWYKWQFFCRQQYEMHFPEPRLLSQILEHFVYKTPTGNIIYIYIYVSKRSANGMVLNQGQAITWTNVDLW